eukprot:PhM_4_TR12819/c0_g1_i1/m.21645
MFAQHPLLQMLASNPAFLAQAQAQMPSLEDLLAKQHEAKARTEQFILTNKKKMSSSAITPSTKSATTDKVLPPPEPTPPAPPVAAPAAAATTPAVKTCSADSIIEERPKPVTTPTAAEAVPFVAPTNVTVKFRLNGADAGTHVFTPSTPIEAVVAHVTANVVPLTMAESAVTVREVSTRRSLHPDAPPAGTTLGDVVGARSSAVIEVTLLAPMSSSSAVSDSGAAGGLGASLARGVRGTLSYLNPFAYGSSAQRQQHVDPTNPVPRGSGANSANSSTGNGFGARVATLSSVREQGKNEETYDNGTNQKFYKK